MMRRNFHLDRARGKIMGVCAGLGVRYDIDVNVIRLGMVVALLMAGPVAIAAYLLIGWFAD